MFEQTKTQGDLHLARKIFHVISIMAILMCMIFLPPKICWIIYFTVGVPLVLMDYFRRYYPPLNRFVLSIIGRVARKHEIRELSGLSYTIMSVGLVFFLFPKPICLLAVMFLAIGDPTASFFGLLYGKTKIFGKKSLVGTAASFGFCFLSALVFTFLWPHEMGAESLMHKIFLSLALGLIGGLSELMSFLGLDDNLTQPLVSSALLSLLFWQLGGVVYV